MQIHPAEASSASHASSDLSARRAVLWVVGALLAAVFLKTALVLAGVVPFNGDEAIVALMARHMLQGEAVIFFYGQAYMGSLDAVLVALGFFLFGEQVWVVRLVQGLLYLSTISTTALLGFRLFGSRRVGVIAAWLLAIPAVNVTLYSTASLGGYGEALLLGNLQLLLAVWLVPRVERIARLEWAFFLFGFLIGLGVWAFGLTLVYSLPAALYLSYFLFKERHKVHSKLVAWLIAGAVGTLLGAAPWWSYAVENGFSQLVWELCGGAIAGVEGLPFWQSVGQHLFSLVVLGTTAVFGFRPPWEVRWLGLPLIPFVLFFWGMVHLHTARRLRQWKADEYHAGTALVVGVIVTLAAGFIFTPFGADPSGRYFLPLAAPFALLGGGYVEHLLRKGFPIPVDKRWAYGLVMLILGYHLWGNIQSASHYPPGITTQFDAVTWIDHRDMPELMDFLKAHGETRGYTNYWVAYPLAFLSQEELIFIPALPYHLDFRHTQRDNRYTPYSSLVEAGDRAAYITTHHPALNERLRQRLAALGVSWEEAQIGDYQVFYALSRKVTPEELVLFPPD